MQQCKHCARGSAARTQNPKPFVNRAGRKQRSQRRMQNQRPTHHNRSSQHRMRASLSCAPAVHIGTHRQIAAPRYRAIRFISLIRDMWYWK